MVTDFGKMIRVYRLEHGLMLKDMADKLNVPSSYLSAMEMGRKTISNEFIERLVSLFPFTEEEKATLNKAVASSANVVKFDLRAMNANKRQMVLSFARKFETLDDETVHKIMNYLSEEEDD